MSSGPVAGASMVRLLTWEITVLGVQETQGSGRDRRGHIDPSRPNWDFCSLF